MNMILQSTSGFIGLLSNDKIPYEWVFTLSNWISVGFGIFITYIITKKLGEKYSLNKNELIISII